MKRLVVSLSLITLLVIAGCANVQVSALRDRCTFTNDPRFEILRGKIPLSPAEAETPPTLAEISNNQVPTAAESKAIYNYDSAYEPCVRDAMALMRNTGGAGATAVAANLRQRTVQELKRLAERQITYGQYRQITYSYYTAAARELQGEINALDIAAAQRQAASAATIAAGAQAIQASRPAPTYIAPKNTTCFRNGAYINCSSY